MRPRKLWPAMALLVLSVLRPGVASSYDPYLVVPPQQVVNASPSHRYAQMTGAQALAELRRRGILFQRVNKKIGRVHTPIRLTGRLHGVYIHSSLPEEQRTETVFEICDARFALALDDFAAILQRHDIVEVVHYTMYRPAMGGASADVSTVSQAARVAEREGAGATDRRATVVSKDGFSWWGSDTELAERGFAKKLRGGRGKAQKPKASEVAGHAAKGADSKQQLQGDEPQAKRAKGAGKSKHTARSAVKSKHAARRTNNKRPASRKHHRGRGKRHGKVRHKSIKHGVKPHRSRHPDGLAIDVGALRKRDGTWLRVSNDFHGAIGSQTCGARAKPPADAKGKELWAIVCEAFDKKVFTYVLTPNFNLAHQDHFHMEIKPGMRWFLYH